MAAWASHLSRHHLVLAAASLLYGMGIFSAAGAEVERTEIVIAEGVGTDAEGARKDAYRNAVRQAVGAYVDSETIIANDELITDRVITLSPAFVEKVEPIAGSEKKEDGLVRLRVRAHVRITKLLDELAAGKIKTRAVTRKIDTTSLVAELTTKADQHEARRNVLAKLFGDYPESCLVVRQAGKESIDKQADGKTVLNVPLSITPNHEGFMAFSKALCAVLSATPRASGEFKVDGGKFGPDPARAKEALAKWVRKAFDNPDGHGNMGNVFPDSLRRQITQSRDSDGLSPLAGPGPTYLLWDGNERGGIDSLYYGAWSKARENRPSGDTILICLTSATHDYRRTSWKWFHVTEGEFKEWFKDLRWSFTCKTQLLDAQDEEVADDVIALRQIGAIARYPSIVWLVPFYVNGSVEPWYTPELRFVRSLEIDPDDAARIAALRVSLERATPADAR